MPPAIRSTVEPPSDRLRVGDCLVDLPLREVRAPGARRPLRITPKSMGVLRVLIDNAGRVVSRDALLAEVWPGTLPTNDVITQAITQLRKAFDDGRDEPRYIETIAKTGYRLLADVEWLPATTPAPAVEEGASPAEDAAAIAEDSRPREEDKASVGRVPPARPLHRWAVVAALAVLAMLAIGGWIGRQTPAGPGKVSSSPEQSPRVPERPYRLITSAPGFELTPALSPDGSQVAYLASLTEELVGGTAILVQTTEPAQPRRLTSPPEGAWDSNPAWSPNGREIAFLRRSPGTDCKIMAVAASGGDPRVLADCDPANRPSFSWTPDGNGLIFSSPVGGSGAPGLRVLDLATGQWRSLNYGATPEDVDLMPRYSPDGRWIGFIRNAPLGDLWRVPAAGGKPERLTWQHAELRGWDWSDEGRSMVFGRRIDSQTRLYRLSLKERSIVDLGIEDAQAPAVALHADQVAFVQRKAHFGIYRIDMEKDGVVVGTPTRLFASSGRDTLPSVAPDGRQLVFTSDRSGEFALWWADMQRPASLRLIEGLRPESRYLPMWSPDSRRVLVVGIDGHGDHGLHEVNPANGQVRQLSVPLAAEDVLFAAYLDDATRLLVIADGDDGQRLMLFDRTQSPWRRLATLEGVSFARADPAQRRVLFTRMGKDGLWQADLDLNPASVRQIDPQYPASQRYRLWTLTETGEVGYLDQMPRCYVSLRHLQTPALPYIWCVERTRLATVNGFSAHSRQRAAFVSMAALDGSDIAFMPLTSPKAPGAPEQSTD